MYYIPFILKPYFTMVFIGNTFGGMPMKLIIAIFIMSLFASCSHEISNIKTDVKDYGHFGSATIGVDSSSRAVITQETLLEKELRDLIISNDMLEVYYKSEKAQLNDCRANLADPKNGGDGEIKPMTSLEPIKKEGVLIEQKYGLLREKLVRYEKQSLTERIEIEKNFNTDLYSLYKQLFQVRRDCERRLSYITQKATKQLKTETVEEKEDSEITVVKPVAHFNLQ